MINSWRAPWETDCEMASCECCRSATLSGMITWRVRDPPSCRGTSTAEIPGVLSGSRTSTVKLTFLA